MGVPLAASGGGGESPTQGTVPTVPYPQQQDHRCPVWPVQQEPYGAPPVDGDKPLIPMAVRLDFCAKGKTMNPQDRVTDLHGLLSQAYPIPESSSDRLDSALLRLAQAEPTSVGKTNGAERPRCGQASPPCDAFV